MEETHPKKTAFRFSPQRSQPQLELSIFGSVRSGPILNKNNQTEFFLKFLNRTENRFKPINLDSVPFGFFPFQTGSN